MKTRLFVLALIALSACNTFEGAGKDIQLGGEALSDAANDARAGI